jgi:hypothetical protein
LLRGGDCKIDAVAFGEIFLPKVTASMMVKITENMGVPQKRFFEAIP